MSNGIASMIRAASRIEAHDIETKRRPIVIGQVYVVGFGPYVKIGFSAIGNLEKRLTTLRQNAPEPLEVYATFGGSRYLERALHRQFKDQHLQGEWFKREGILGKWIADGCPTTSPTETLTESKGTGRNQTGQTA